MCAVGALACEPPSWLMAGISADDTHTIASAVTPRRRRELLWSRGLKAGLDALVLERETNAMNHATRPVAQFSITHDRHFAAVAMSQYGAIGMDLQTDCRLESCHRIAETWFPHLESEEILASENCDRFLLSWVSKEAYAKCMNCSIFDACRAIGVWQGKVRIADGAVDAPQFAWSRQYFGVNKPPTDRLPSAGPDVALPCTLPQVSVTGFAMGIYLRGKAPNAPKIECLTLGLNSKFCHFAADWEWLPVASKSKSA